MDELGERSIAKIFQHRKGIPSVEPADQDVHNAQTIFLHYLAITLCVQTGVSPIEAEASARCLYADAQHAYVASGGTIYGSSHVGLMRWIAERLDIVPHVAQPDFPST